LRKLEKAEQKESEINLYKCEASFDLDDCDRILRVKCTSGNIQSDHIIDIMTRNGFYADVLPENYPLPIIQSLLTSSLCQ